MIVAQVDLYLVVSRGCRIIYPTSPKSYWKVTMASIELAFELGPS